MNIQDFLTIIKNKNRLNQANCLKLMFIVFLNLLQILYDKKFRYTLGTYYSFDLTILDDVYNSFTKPEIFKKRLLHTKHQTYH